MIRDIGLGLAMGDTPLDVMAANLGKAGSNQNGGWENAGGRIYTLVPGMLACFLRQHLFQSLEDLADPQNPNKLPQLHCAHDLPDSADRDALLVGRIVRLGDMYALSLIHI